MFVSTPHNVDIAFVLSPSVSFSLSFSSFHSSRSHSSALVFIVNVRRTSYDIHNFARLYFWLEFICFGFVYTYDTHRQQRCVCVRTTYDSEEREKERKSDGSEETKRREEGQNSVVSSLSAALWWRIRSVEFLLAFFLSSSHSLSHSLSFFLALLTAPPSRMYIVRLACCTVTLLYSSRRFQTKTGSASWTLCVCACVEYITHHLSYTCSHKDGCLPLFT